MNKPAIHRKVIMTADCFKLCLLNDSKHHRIYSNNSRIFTYAIQYSNGQFWTLSRENALNVIRAHQ